MTVKPSTREGRRRYSEAADWLLRRRGDELTADEAAAFDAWLARDPLNRTAYEAAERLMSDARTAILSDQALRDFDVAPRRRGTTKLAVAALLAAMAAAGFLLADDGRTWLQADAISNAGEMPVIALPDGSTIQLNARSAVAHDFTPTVRTVRLLRGEAYFQVAPDSQRPFVVEAGGGRTTAIGTAFDVRLDPVDTTVTVTEHAVSVAAAGLSDAAVRVQQGEQTAYGRDGRAQPVRRINTNAALAWRRGQLVADNTPLSYVVTEIGRNFSGRIVIAGAALSDRRVSGTFTITDPDAALAFLEQTLGIRAVRLGPLIIIHG